MVYSIGKLLFSVAKWVYMHLRTPDRSFDLSPSCKSVSPADARRHWWRLRRLLFGCLIEMIQQQQPASVQRRSSPRLEMKVAGSNPLVTGQIPHLATHFYPWPVSWKTMCIFISLLKKVKKDKTRSEMQDRKWIWSSSIWDW